MAELLAVIAAKIPPADKLGQLETIVAARGGCEILQKACEEYSNHSPSRWQPFAYRAFSPYRTELLLLGRTLPLKAARPSANNLIEAVHSVVTEPTTSDYYVVDLDGRFCRRSGDRLFAIVKGMQSPSTGVTSKWSPYWNSQKPSKRAPST